jgi:hypothetical protein
VILKAGYRNRADIWSEPPQSNQRQIPVFPGIAGFTRLCACDRPGTTIGTNQVSRSDPMRMSRTARDAVADLHAMIRAARIPGPYLGGTLNRGFARPPLHEHLSTG